ncbi:hypothetical protein LIER_43507 [Lithospermum erythrorhizon]|uniref:Uncharacterized protein n=1 Tax=Lithospermum erythrorhizon TaxID=34254 RepID=A0AAV3Q940_LITER
MEDEKSDNEKGGGATSVDAMLDHFPDSALTVGFPVGKGRGGATFVDAPLDRSPDSVFTVGFSIGKCTDLTTSVDASLEQSSDSVFTVGLPVEEAGVVPHLWMPHWVMLPTVFSPAYFL